MEVTLRRLAIVEQAWAETQNRLDEAEETLRAIRNGEVDALVISDGLPEERVFTLSSVDKPYRIFVENMTDGAATLSQSGVVLYANPRLVKLLEYPMTSPQRGAAASSQPRWTATPQPRSPSSPQTGIWSLC
jgi:PAS domain-containing protein